MLSCFHCKTFYWRNLCCFNSVRKWRLTQWRGFAVQQCKMFHSGVISNICLQLFIGAHCSVYYILAHCELVIHKKWDVPNNNHFRHLHVLKININVITSADVKAFTQQMMINDTHWRNECFMKFVHCVWAACALHMLNIPLSACTVYWKAFMVLL